ncbi:MAG: hypothetical protein RMJ98_05530 [Myxococcales bacterium]|nr:hypothetical protein [Polyangiaceae bacterium]MDW8248752.1 hypothetical protein [Myxococcales bacterium]
MKDDFRDSFTEFALDKRPSNPEIARVLREVRRRRGQKRPRYLPWFLGVGGWIAAAVSLVLLAKQSHEPQREQALIQRDPEWVEPPAPPRETPAASPPLRASLPPPSATSAPARRPVLSVRPPPSVISLASAPASSVDAPAASSIPLGLPPAGSVPVSTLAPRLPFEESLLLARGHLHRMESVLEVLRETGMGVQAGTQQQCFAEQYRKVLGLYEVARGQLPRLEAAARSGDAPTFDLELERLVNLRRAADGEFSQVRVCFGVRGPS